MATNMEIARTILYQMGGPRNLTMMTGAGTFLALERGVQFSLPSNFAQGGINRVQVTLNDQDTYDVKFMNLRRGDFSIKSSNTYENVQAEDLRKVFMEETGLELRPPVVIAPATPRRAHALSR